MPILIYGLTKTNAQYRVEDAVLDEGVALRPARRPCSAATRSIVLVDRIDLATARAIQYARSLTPDELYAVHFNIDNRRAEAVMRRWRDLGPLPPAPRGHRGADRRLGRAALEMAGRGGRGRPDRGERPDPDPDLPAQLGVLLHGKNADRLVRVLGHVPHVNATLVPFNVADLAESQRALRHPEDLPPKPKGTAPATTAGSPRFAQVAGTIPLSDAPAPPAGQGRRDGSDRCGSSPGRGSRPRMHPHRRQRRRAPGRVPRAGATIRRHPHRHQADRRRHGRRAAGRLAMINPQYELLSVPETASRRRHRLEGALSGRAATGGAWAALRGPSRAARGEGGAGLLGDSDRGEQADRGRGGSRTRGHAVATDDLVPGPHRQVHLPMRASGDRAVEPRPVSRRVPRRAVRPTAGPPRTSSRRDRAGRPARRPGPAPRRAASSPTAISWAAPLMAVKSSPRRTAIVR